MPESRELDVRQLSSLVLPYDVQTKELSDGPPRLVAGNNTYITNGGKIAQAPGLNDTGLTAFTLTKRIDRIVIYETIETSPKIFLVASVLNAGVWEVQYLRLDAGAPAWTSAGSTRGINASIYPHEFTVARGLVFVKGFANSQKIGAVILDGTGGTVTVKVWGIDGPNATITYLGLFGAGANPQPILFGWRYAYAYLSSTGQISNHSTVIGNAGFTGAFTVGIPRVQVAYTTDTAVTKINIYRTSDGGGTFYYLAQINNNTAGGNVNYDDNGSSSNPGFPRLDNELDVTNIAPSETSNSYPPAVMDLSNSGALINRCTPPQYFARRIWYFMGNRLYYTGNEEILNGVPEESFPAPYGLRGNFYLFQSEGRQLKATKRALYYGTSNEYGVITGQDKTNFLPDTIVNDVGAPIGHPKAITSFRDSIFFMTSDLQIYGITGANPPTLISGPLGSTLRTTVAAAATTSVQLEIFSRDGNSWLIVNVTDTATIGNTRQFVYDLAREIWFTPWTKPVSAMVFGRIRETDQQKHLIVATWNGTTAKISVLDTSYLSDVGTNFTPAFTTNLFTLPAGNHINELRRPAHVPLLAYLMVERTKFTSDTDPTVAYRLDEFSGSTTTVTATDPPYLTQHTSYKDHWYPIDLATERAQLSLTGTGGQALEIQNIAFAFQSEAGV